MKKLAYYTILVMVFFDCRKPQDTPPLQTILTNGSWHISVFKENSRNRTFLFSSWQFTFNSDKTLVVTNGINTYPGVWDENTGGDTFTLQINSSALELIYISEIWHNKLLNPRQVLFHNDRVNAIQELQFTKL